MFQTLLVRKYLFSKAMPLLAALAVLLCTAMVLVTWSVMNGFLNKLVASGRTMTGDVIISYPNVGIPHYEDLLQRLQSDPTIEAASPVVESFALLGLPNGRSETVFLRGVDGPTYGRVTKYDEILWWRPLDTPLPKDAVSRKDPRLALDKTDLRLDLETYLSNGRTLTRGGKPAAVLGVEVSGFNYRTIEGFYEPRLVAKANPDGTTSTMDIFLPGNPSEIIVTVMRTDTQGISTVGSVSRSLPVANEFHSGVFEADSRVVLARLDIVQEMLGLGAGKRVATPQEVERMRASGTLPAPAAGRPKAPSLIKGGEALDDDEEGFAGANERVLIDDPARVTHILVRGKGDLGTLGAASPLRDRVEEIYAQFALARGGSVPIAPTVMTWEDQNRTMIMAVQKETGLVLFLFSMISLVAVVLVLTIFWSMIAEKTKDIGIVRALGASRGGIAWTWILYGLMIGLVGASLGVALAYVIVTNINPIHDWLGAALGITVWDPRIYYFTEIPKTVETRKAILVFVAFVVSCVIGAIVPALRAAYMDPVRALRFE